MKSILLASGLILATSFAGARELDNDSAYTNQQSLKGTVIVRVNTQDNTVAYTQAAQIPGSEKEAIALSANSSYRKVGAANLRSELDQDGGASSWYWYPGYNYNAGYNWGYGYNYQYSNLYWYGSYYRPTYYYSYGSYQYYYYSSYSYRWW